MAWSYAPLWKTLIDRKMKKTDLLSAANVNSRTLAKMGKDENISMEILGRICQALECKIEDVICYIPSEQ